MNEAGFYKGFRFVQYRYGKYRCTDCSQGSDRHFIGYLEQGHCKLVSQDVTLEVSAGEAFYIPMGLPYRSYWHGEQVCFRSYGFRFFPEAQNRSFALQKLPPDFVPMILEIPLQRTPDSCALSALFGLLGKLVPRMTLSPLGMHHALLLQAMDYMHENPQCTNEQVAAHCCISPATLYTLFRRESGSTPNEARQAMAVKKAVQLLTTTDLPIQHISDQLHFSSTSYFRKVLRKHTGKTPMQIRKANISI